MKRIPQEYKKSIESQLFLTTILLLFAILFSSNGYTQDHHEEEHHHHKNEVSIALGVVPLPSEDKVTMGIHLHYVRGLGHKNRFGIGAGLETILDKHKHVTLSAVFEYRVYKGLILGYGPGLLIVIEDSETEYKFAQHFEVAYEFELGKFHIGPMAELGLESEEVHYMIGVHFGLDF